MIPIYEQGTGNGIGHNLRSFLERFDKICEQHLAKGRAKSFAFIFYDFNDRDLRSVLKNQGVFAKLDRLSGTELSIFYLHAGTRVAVESFNKHFFSVLGIQEKASLPCVVFFRVHESAIEDIEIAQLENADLVHGFAELNDAIKQFIAKKPIIAPEPSRAIRWFKVSAKFLSLEVFRNALRQGFELFL